MGSVQLKRVLDKVKNKLEKDERTRDNDGLLCSLIWFSELPHANYTAAEFLREYAHGDHFTNAESIRRCRQKLQEQHPELRGKSYQERKRKTAKVKTELGYGKDAAIKD